MVKNCNKIFDNSSYSVLNKSINKCLNFENNDDVKKYKLIKQHSIFNLLEKDLPIKSVNIFEKQVHFQEANAIPIQRWFPYREGYSVKLVTSFLDELKIKGNVFDPFSGSGTTLLASRYKNLQSFGVDVNPISILVATVENEQYTNEDIASLIEEIDIIKKIEKSDFIFDVTFNLAGKMFNAEILQTMLQFKAYIKSIKNEKIQNLLYVAWLSIMEDVSNIKKEGNGIKYKNRKRTPSGYINIPKEEWENSNFPIDKFVFVRDELLKKINIYLYDIQNNYGLSNKRPKIFQDDCLNFDDFISDEINFSFFSPPYCNCFDYFEIHKVELWLGDFIKDTADFKLLRKRGFRSNTNALDGQPIIYHNDYIEKLINMFDIQMLWNKKIPFVVRGYFDDMHMLLKKIYLHTQKGGYVGIVIGNSAYSGIIIPSDALIANIAQEIGFDVENIFITRHLTTSSQQKIYLEPLNDYLRESIVLLKKN